MAEKLELPLHSKGASSSRKKVYSLFIGINFILILCTLFSYGSDKSKPIKTSIDVFRTFMQEPHEPNSLCPIVPKIDPSDVLHNPDTINYILSDKSFHTSVRKKLLNAVKIPTEIFDGMENPQSVKSLKELYELDPRWKPFEKFHDYLEKTYPLVHKHLQLKKINKFGLVYTWKGNDTSKSQ